MNTERIDEIFAAYRQAGSPGCAVAIMQGGEVIYQQGYGRAQVEHDQPITPATVFNIGSESKQFTAFAILLLIRDGHLTLDTALNDVLPDMPDFGQTITIRHLLHHTSGLRCTFPTLLALAGWREADVTTTDDVIRLLRAQRELNFVPGAEFSYSNSNYIVLGQIVEHLSGQSLAAFCQEQIFDPLGMASTLILDQPYRVVPRRAQSYYQLDNGTLFAALIADSVTGPTNVYTTVEDLARWDANFYTGAVGGLDLIEQMHTRGVLNDGTLLDYACGLSLGHHRGRAIVEHGGVQAGYCAHLVRFPAEHLSVAVLCNVFTRNARQYALAVADHVLGDGDREPEAKTAEPRADVIALSAEQLAAYVGTYYHPGKAAVRVVTLDETQLRIMGMTVNPVSATTFVYADHPAVKATFTLADGSPRQLRINNGETDTRYDWVATAELTPRDLRAYAGCYYSTELDVYWTLAVKDDQLVGQHRKYDDTVLTPAFVDAFVDDWTPILGYPTRYLLVFARDANGDVCGFRLSDTRVRHLKFDKLREGTRFELPLLVADRLG